VGDTLFRAPGIADRGLATYDRLGHLGDVGYRPAPGLCGQAETTLILQDPAAASAAAFLVIVTFRSV
jgi:hypothetical protein